MKNFYIKTKTWLSDHFHLLFKSAADNHLRIQHCTDGSYQCLIRFNSYSELKRYQKRVRRVTVSLSSAVAMVVVAFLVAPYIMNPNRSSAANYQWIQNNWDNSSTGSTTKTGWKSYVYKDPGINASTTGVTLVTPQVANTGDSVYTGGTGFYRADSSGAYSASGTILALSKPIGATCGNMNECKGGSCTSSVCKVVNGGQCTADTDCESGWCNAGSCANVWISGPCNGITVYKSNSSDSSAASSGQPCTSLGGRLPSSTELFCIFANTSSYVASSFVSGQYFVSSYSDVYRDWVSYPGQVLSNSGGYAPVGHNRCVK